MKIKKLSETDSVLPRKEYEFELTYEGVTPSRIELKNSLTSNTKSKPEVSVVTNVLNDFGAKKAIVHFRVYKDEESMNKIELKENIVKNTPPKKEEPEEPKQEEAPKEEKAQESKEDTPKEEKGEK